MKSNADSQSEAEFIPTRATLLSRLKDMADHQSWRAFFETYWKLIYSVALKSGLRDSDAQEVVQETIIAVSRNIETFKYDPKRCSFKSWLMQVTRSRISNQFRKLKRAEAHLNDPRDGPEMLELLADERDGLAMLWEQEWEKNIMDAAVTRVKKQVSIEQFQLFDFAVLRDFPASKVARIFDVSTARVYLAKHRITKLIKAEARKIEREMP